MEDLIPHLGYGYQLEWKIAIKTLVELYPLCPPILLLIALQKEVHIHTAIQDKLRQLINRAGTTQQSYQESVKKF